MKKILLFSFFLGILIFGGNNNVAFAGLNRPSDLLEGERITENNITTGFAAPYVALGYTCTMTIDWQGQSIDCVKDMGYTYSADTVSGDPYTLVGTKTVNDDLSASDYTEYTSPFVYFSNPPQGNIAVTLDSPLNSYLPIPSFNTTNGWNVIGDKQKGTIFIDGKEQKNLFYELAMNSVTLNRYGQNFNSKEEITSYLQNSNFFDNLGFSQEQKENSLSYVLQKLNNSKVNTKYYYLTILTDESVADISTLTIQPKPKKIIRTYFAVYPTDVPIATEGNIIFPEIQEDNNNFVIKETGEFLIPNDMFVFFK